MSKNVAFLVFLIIMPLFMIYFISGVDVSQGDMIQQPDETLEIVNLIILNPALSFDLGQTFASGLLVQFLLLTGALAASIVVKERQEHIIMRMFAAPVKKIEILLGNLLGQMIIVSIVAAVIIGISAYGMGIYWGKSWLDIFILTAITIFVATTLGFLCSSIFKSSSLVTGVMSFIIIMMTFLSGSFTPNLEPTLLNNLTINRWSNEGYIRLMQEQSLSSIASNLSVLAIIGIVFMVVAWLIYRREEIYE